MIRKKVNQEIIPITFVCTLDSLIKPGSYSLEKPDNEALKITTTDPIELPPCSSDMISSDEGSDLEVKSEELIDDLKRAEIKLSFRQVLDFDKTKFNFIGLTTEKIEAKTEITFMIYLKLGKEKQSKPVDVKCVNNLAAEVSDKNPVAIVSFECSIPVEYEYQKDFDSIEIASSEFVAGLPVDETLLNPVLTDAEIKEDPSKNKTTMEPPTLADFKGEITNEMIKEGKFEFSIELGLEKPELQGSTFKMPLVFPEGIVLEFTILEVKGTKVSFSVEIIGEVNEQPLVLEQTIIIINGEEAFILPGIVTEKITTEGVKEDSNNILTSDEEGKTMNYHPIKIQVIMLEKKENPTKKKVNQMSYLLMNLQMRKENQVIMSHHPTKVENQVTKLAHPTKKVHLQDKFLLLEQMKLLLVQTVPVQIK